MEVVKGNKQTDRVLKLLDIIVLFSVKTSNNKKTTLFLMIILSGLEGLDVSAT